MRGIERYFDQTERLLQYKRDEILGAGAEAGDLLALAEVEPEFKEWLKGKPEIESLYHEVRGALDLVDSIKKAFGQ